MRSPAGVPRRSPTTASRIRPGRPAAVPRTRGGARRRCPPPLSVRTPVRSIIGPALVFATPAGAASTAGMVPVPMGGPTGGREQLLGSLTRRSHAGDGPTRAALSRRRHHGRPRPSAAVHAERPSRAATKAERPCSGCGCERRGTNGSAARRPGARLPCGELRTVADERCEVASRARVEAERAQETLRPHSVHTTRTCSRPSKRRARRTRARSAPPRTRRNEPSGKPRRGVQPRGCRRGRA